MNIDFLMLKAQFNALRNFYMGHLGSNPDKDIAWRDKYLLWEFERDLLSSCDNTQLSSPENEILERRRFQLQVLMDVAYLQGHLEQFGVARLIQPGSREIADAVFRNSDGSEETMIPLIDRYF